MTTSTTDASTELPVLADSVRLDPDGVHVLDRRCFPFRREWVRCGEVEEVANAIENMVTQSCGPLFAALQGMILAARALPDELDEATGRERVHAAGARLIATRPTNNHIREGVEAVLAAVDHTYGGTSALREAVEHAATEAENAYRDSSRALGERAAALLPDSGTVLTHCWADLYLVETVRAAQQSGKNLHFVCTETRPYLQGARLTAETLAEMGVDTTLVTDGTGAAVLARGEVDVLLTAADRVTMDGHVVNKVGTLSLAVAAHTFGVPYLALVPGPDPQAPTAQSVPLEQRDGEDVLHALGTRTASTRVRGHYPAFDVTPPRFVTRVVTDRGAFAPDAVADYWTEHAPRSA